MEGLGRVDWRGRRPWQGGRTDLERHFSASFFSLVVWHKNKSYEDITSSFSPSLLLHHLLQAGPSVSLAFVPLDSSLPFEPEFAGRHVFDQWLSFIYNDTFWNHAETLRARFSRNSSFPLVSSPRQWVPCGFCDWWAEENFLVCRRPPSRHFFPSWEQTGPVHRNYSQKSFLSRRVLFCGSGRISGSLSSGPLHWTCWGDFIFLQTGVQTVRW